MSDSSGDEPRESALGKWFPPRHSRLRFPAVESGNLPDDDQGGDGGGTDIQSGAGRRTPAAMARIAGNRSARLAAALVVALLLAGSVLGYAVSHRGTTITANFTEAIGIYPGSDVRVLGVRVGAVTATQPNGHLVKVTMRVDSGIRIPAGARALIVTDSVVADRYVQLTPAYTGGPALADGAVIPLRRTAVPVEVDQIYASLDKFFAALGPHGFNSSGALSGLIRTGASVMRGNGANLAAMLTQFSALNKTLGNSSADFFATVANLHGFSSMLRGDDSQVRLAEQQLAAVTSYFASDRQNLTAAIGQLAVALHQVQVFIAANRALIKSNVGKLAAITSLLVRERAALAEALSAAPLALDNLLNAYDAAHKTLDGRGDLNELSLGPAARRLAALASLVPAGAVPVQPAALTALPPLPLPAVGTIYAVPGTGTAGGRR